MKEYITFEKLNLLASLDPHWGDDWENTPEKNRRKYHAHLLGLIESHRWQGVALDTPVQESAFPRVVDCSLVRWDSDTETQVNHTQYQGHCHVLSSAVIAQTAIAMFADAEFKRQRVQRDMGIALAQVGPLEVEFVGKNANTTPTHTLPLPQPLWDHLKQYSMETLSDTKNRWVKIARA